MADILNLALKKDVFEAIMNKASDEIPIEKSNWWKKRLEDVDNGGFKDFKIARISSGSPEKFDYPIKKIELRGKVYIVTVDLGNNELAGADSDPAEETPKTMEEIQAEINKAFLKETYVSPEFTVTENTEEIDETKADDYDYRKDVMTLIDAFCENKDVYPVILDSVIIRPNGMVAGCKKKIIADRFNTTKMEFTKVEIIKYKDVSDEYFLQVVADKLKSLLSGNIVFIRRKGCGFTKITSGEDMLVMSVAVRKKYLFGR